MRGRKILIGIGKLLLIAIAIGAALYLIALITAKPAQRIRGLRRVPAIIRRWSSRIKAARTFAPATRWGH